MTEREKLAYVWAMKTSNNSGLPVQGAKQAIIEMYTRCAACKRLYRPDGQIVVVEIKSIPPDRIQQSLDCLRCRTPLAF